MPSGGSGPHDRRQSLQNPECEPFERFGIRHRVGIPRDEAGHQHLRLGDRHADAKAGGQGGGINRQHDPPASFPADQDKRRLNRRSRLANLPPQPVGGPGRQE